MPRKGENIRKRKDGRWEGRFKTGVKENGTIRYCSVYGKTYKEVKEKLITCQHDYQNGTIAVSGETYFSKVLSLWQQSNRIRIKGGTERRYDYLIKTHIMPELGGLKLSQITAATVNAFLNNKLNNGRLDGDGGLSPSYVRNMMVIVNSVIKFAVNERLCLPLKNPIYKPQTEKSELRLLDIEEQKRLEQYTRANLSPTGIGILISLYTGLRIGEVCALSWDDVDLVNKIIHVRHTVARVKNDEREFSTKTRLIIDEPKTKASKRDVPIPSALLPVMLVFRDMSCSNFIVSDKAEFLSPRTYEYRYHRILKCCGVSSINYHALRHTFATRCIVAGVDVKSLSEVLGHGNSVITLDTYVHSSMELKRNQLEKLISPVV